MLHNQKALEDDDDEDDNHAEEEDDDGGGDGEDDEDDDDGGGGGDDDVDDDEDDDDDDAEIPEVIGINQSHLCSRLLPPLLFCDVEYQSPVLSQRGFPIYKFM
nr:unnamed protein product [Spirometra erinaceieuropaei]